MPSNRPCARCDLPIEAGLDGRLFCRRQSCIRLRMAAYKQRSRAGTAGAYRQRGPRVDPENGLVLPPLPPPEPLPEPRREVVYDGEGALVGVRVWRGGDSLTAYDGPSPLDGRRSFGFGFRGGAR